MSSYQQAVDALAAQLGALLPDLRVSNFVPPQINPPAAIVAPNPADLADYEVIMSSDTALWYVRVVLVVGLVKDDAAQATMNAMIATTGPTSVIHAIRSDPTLSGTVEWAEPKTAGKYGAMNYAGQDYLGCELTIEVSC